MLRKDYPLDDFRRFLLAAGYSPGTIHVYVVGVRAVLRGIGGADHALDADALQQYYERITAERSTAVCSQHVNAWRAFSAFVEDGGGPDLPLLAPRAARPHRRASRTAVDDTFVQALGPVLAGCVHFMRRRSRDPLKLTWDHLAAAKWSCIQWARPYVIAYWKPSNPNEGYWLPVHWAVQMRTWARPDGRVPADDQPLFPLDEGGMVHATARVLIYAAHRSAPLAYEATPEVESSLPVYVPEIPVVDPYGGAPLSSAEEEAKLPKVLREYRADRRAKADAKRAAAQLSSGVRKAGRSIPESEAAVAAFVAGPQPAWKAPGGQEPEEREEQE